MKVLPALEKAWERMVNRLFRPFDMVTWLLLGFSAWLASLIHGLGFGFRGGGGNWSQNWSSESQNLSPEKMWMYVGIFIAIVIVVVIICMVCLWVGCRGQFMFLDNVVNGTTEVKEPWKKYREPANRFFGFYILYVTGVFLFALVWLVAVVVIGVMSKLSTNPDAVAYIPLVLALIFGVTSLIIATAILQFVLEWGIIWIYRNGGGGWEAMRKILSLAGEHPGFVLRYLLLRVGIGLVIVVVFVIAGCATCCIGFLPYVSSVLMLPAMVLLQWFAIESFALFGPEYDVRPGNAAPPLPPTGQAPGLPPVID